MKTKQQWIELAKSETTRKARAALDTYFASTEDGRLRPESELSKVGPMVDDLLGFLLREGFKLVDDEIPRGP